MRSDDDEQENVSKIASSNPVVSRNELEHGLLKYRATLGSHVLINILSLAWGGIRNDPAFFCSCESGLPAFVKGCGVTDA